MWRRSPKIQALIFDVGGVVMHADLDGFLHVAGMAFGCKTDVLAPIAAPLVADLERGQIDSYSLWDEMGEQLSELGLGVAQDPEKLEHIWDSLLEDSVRVDEGMMKLCSMLATAMPVAALSNTIQDHAAYFQALGLYRHFNPCILSFEVGMRKPEPEIYLLAAKLLNTSPKKCLFIDDREENISGAKAVKMKTHLFTDRESLEKDLVRLGVLERV